MSNNKQSSVEFILDNLHLKDSLKWAEIIQQAKEMHQKEIEETARTYFHMCSTLTPNQYYNIKFGGKNE